MTKVEAIERVLLDNGGAGSLSYIYDNIERYYPGAKIRGNGKREFVEFYTGN